MLDVIIIPVVVIIIIIIVVVIEVPVTPVESELSIEVLADDVELRVAASGMDTIGANVAVPKSGLVDGDVNRVVERGNNCVVAVGVVAGSLKLVSIAEVEEQVELVAEVLSAVFEIVVV